MPLQIYKSNKKAICFNDAFFNSDTSLNNSEFEQLVLKHLEKAVFVSSTEVRSLRTGAIYSKNSLSTGCKTLLNIEKHPELCFDIRECGNNAKVLLMSLDKGQVLWGNFSLATDDAYAKCLINFEGIACNTVIDFLRCLENK